MQRKGILDFCSDSNFCVTLDVFKSTTSFVSSCGLSPPKHRSNCQDEISCAGVLREWKTGILSELD